jgi:hypothetical protein
MSRKKFISSVLVLLISSSFFLTSAFAETVSGIVYNDKNRNGQLDKNEKGVRDVAVSNGVNVVLTD